MVTIDNIAKITKLNDENFQIICKDGKCTILQATFNLCIGINGEIPIIQPLGEYIEKNKDTGVFEYIDTTIDKLRALKLKELELFKKSVLNQCFIKLTIGGTEYATVPTTIDEAHSVLMNKKNEKEPFSYEIIGENKTIINISTSVAEDFFDICEKYRQARGTYKRNTVKEIEDAQTQEDLDKIQFIEGTEKVYAGKPFILQPLVLVTEKTEQMDIVETIATVIEEEVIEVAEEETIEISTEETTGTFQDIKEETPLNNTTSDIKEVSEEFSMF